MNKRTRRRTRTRTRRRTRRGTRSRTRRWTESRSCRWWRRSWIWSTARRRSATISEFSTARISGWGPTGLSRSFFRKLPRRLSISTQFSTTWILGRKLSFRFTRPRHVNYNKLSRPSTGNWN